MPPAKITGSKKHADHCRSTRVGLAIYIEEKRDTESTYRLMIDA